MLEKKTAMDEKLSDDRVLMSCGSRMYGSACFDVLEVQILPRCHCVLD